MAEAAVVPGLDDEVELHAHAAPELLHALHRRIRRHGAVLGARRVDEREEVDRAELRERAQHVGDAHGVPTADRPRERLGDDQRPHAYMLSYSRSAHERDDP